MKHYQDGQTYVAVLEKGENLMDCLMRFVEETGVNNAWLQGIGAVLEVELGYYDLAAREYRWRVFNGPLEITGLHGNISQKDGQPVFHFHGTFAGRDYGVIGGHIKKLTVAATCEIFIQKVNAKLTRRHDDAVGLDLLQSEL